MTFAQATIDLCVAYDNLSTAINHYETYDNLLLDQSSYLESYCRSLDRQ